MTLTTQSNTELQQIADLDARLIRVASRVKVLSSLAWDPALQPTFLDAWERGQDSLPEVSYRQQHDLDSMHAREAIAAESTSLAHPLGDFLAKTASSYLNAMRMLDAAGTQQLSDLSIEVYGRPGDPLSGGRQTTSLGAANYFIEVAKEFYGAHLSSDYDLCLPASTVKRDIERGLGEVFGAGVVEVTIDPRLASKAAAGAERIRPRSSLGPVGLDRKCPL